MLCSDVVMTKLPGFFERKFKDPFGSRCEGDFNCNKSRTPTDDFFNFNPSILEVDPHGLQNLCGNTGSLTDQTEQDLFGAYKVVTQPTCLLLGQHDHLDGLLGKPFEHRLGRCVDVTKLSGLGGSRGGSVGSVTPQSQTALQRGEIDNKLAKISIIFIFRGRETERLNRHFLHV